jgi:uncharacterized protein YaaW (UPF0174 family)
MSTKFISNDVLIELLEQTTEDERLSLTKILNEYQKTPYTPKRIQEELSNAGGNSFMNLYRGEGTGYIDIVDDVLNKLELNGLPSYLLEIRHCDEKDALEFDESEARKKGIKYVEKSEEKIILKLLEQAYKKMSVEDKASFDEQMNHVARMLDSDASKNLTGVAGLMVLGNMGGFATYTFLTTAMSTITMGTLGFGAYTAATSLLSIVLGPIGWAGLGIFAAYSIGGENYQKTIPCVAIIGAVRQRIKYEDSINKRTTDG